MSCPLKVSHCFRLLTAFAFVLLCHSPLSAQDISPAELKQVLKAEQDRIAIVEKVTKPTLAVFGPDGGGGGSGVIVTPDGYALTNYHVTQPCGDYMQCGMSDGVLYDAVIVGFDPVGDVALIKFCLLYTSPSPRDATLSRMPSSA